MYLVVETIQTRLRSPKISSYQLPHAKNFIFAQSFERSFRNGCDGNGFAHGVEDFDGVTFAAVARDLLPRRCSRIQMVLTRSETPFGPCKVARISKEVSKFGRPSGNRVEWQDLREDVCHQLRRVVSSRKELSFIGARERREQIIDQFRC